MTKQRIEDLLDEKNMNQAELAEKIGITAATLSRNINGVNPPKAEIVSLIADFFDVSVDYLLGRTNNKEIVNDIDDFAYALYGETKDLTDEQKQDILDMAKKMTEIMKK